MAQGFLKQDPDLEVYSAGVEVHGVNPRAVQVMKEVGIDISNQTSNHIDEYQDIDFEVVITVCDNAREKCPVFPSKAMKIHYNFPDPARAQGTEKEILNEFRRVRDMIRRFCEGI
jgi:arsenate reductase